MGAAEAGGATGARMHRKKLIHYSDHVVQPTAAVDAAATQPPRRPSLRLVERRGAALLADEAFLVHRVERGGEVCIIVVHVDLARVLSGGARQHVFEPRVAEQLLEDRNLG